MGERSRNIFLVVAALEIAALIPAAQRWRKGVHLASAVVGLGGAFSLYETGEHLEAMSREFTNNRAVEERQGKLR